MRDKPKYIIYHPKPETMTREDLNLTFIDPVLMFDLMSVPSVFWHEGMMQDFLMHYACLNGIESHQDEAGNVYLQKGCCAEGEYYPCFSAHMDSVQLDQLPYIEKGERLVIKTGTQKDLHTLYTDDFGLGGDDKAGILISLTVMSRLEKAKAVFFVAEEKGCLGSEKMDVEWFRDVGYVIAFDSPGLWRASYSCWGIKLFDTEFFRRYLEPLSLNFGRVIYVADAYTDVKNIREKTELACMNMGAGYYDYHSSGEYCIVEHMDQACEIGLTLVGNLGSGRYVIPLDRTLDEITRYRPDALDFYINGYNNAEKLRIDRKKTKNEKK